VFEAWPVDRNPQKAAWGKKSKQQKSFREPEGQTAHQGGTEEKEKKKIRVRDGSGEAIVKERTDRPGEYLPPPPEGM